ncbi:PAS domain S-box protein [Pedobacter sp. SYSU D00535]|uniref:PAS domain S-box protein n=1 Tax=Pedobacter sp. SYSU D00535 TaxID=2810308 RepID=UPI001A975D1A|nr:PAS domain S-box protein [Pedobacter sp. SYSU D00535]
MSRPIKAVFIYIVVGVIWILVSDRIIEIFTSSLPVEDRLIYQSAKGILFILITAILLYIIVKKLQEKYLASERQYRKLFADNPNPMWIYNVETLRFIEVNDAAIEKYGYSREEFSSMTVLDIRKDEEKTKLLEFIGNLKKVNGTSGEWKHLKKSGEEFNVSIKSHRVWFQNQQCALVLAVDITDKIAQQRRLEEAYQKEIELNEALATHIELIKQSNEENRRFAQIISKISNIVIVTDRGGKIIWVNKAFSEVTGYSFQEALGCSPRALLNGPESLQEEFDIFLENIKTTKMVSCIEMVNYTKEKEAYWVEVTMTPLFDEQGGFEGLIAVENVITERKQRERKIEEQNKVLRQIAWVSSHEVRRPVSSIISLVSLLKTLDGGREKEECLDLLELSSKELDTIVRQITKKVNHAEL